MKLKLTLTVLALLFSNSISQEQEVNSYFKPVYETLKTLDYITKFEFQGLNINLRERRIIYPLQKDLLYFYVKNDHNGEPLYSLTYLHTFDVQAYFKKLQRITQGRTNKKTKNYSEKS